MTLRNISPIELLRPSSVEQAVSMLGAHKGEAMILAGGTDLVGALRLKIFPQPPKVLVNLKSISGMNYIKEDAEGLKIGALTTLTEIETHTTIQQKYQALSQAAKRVGTPQLKNAGTIGGNICQQTRCWFYRTNYITCLRKGGGMCYATVGNNKFHSIFGGIGGCVAANQGDVAPALVALNAKIKTSKRTINIEGFFGVNGIKTTVLDDDELVTEIQIPAPAAGSKSAFRKVAARKSFDFPMVNCAAAIGGGDARICLNAVFNKPYRATKAEDAIKGKTIDETNAEAAGTAAVTGSTALPYNKYKVQLAKGLVKKAILACA